MITQHNQQWTQQQQKQNWLINLLFGCRQQREAYIQHLNYLESVIQELTAKNNTIKTEFDNLKIDYQKLREENFAINIDIAQKEKTVEELMEVIEAKKIDLSQSLPVDKPKRRVKF